MPKFLFHIAQKYINCKVVKPWFAEVKYGVSAGTAIVDSITIHPSLLKYLQRSAEMHDEIDIAAQTHFDDTRAEAITHCAGDDRCYHSDMVQERA